MCTAAQQSPRGMLVFDAWVCYDVGTYIIVSVETSPSRRLVLAD